MRPLLWIVAAAALLAAAPSPGAHAAEVSVGLAAGASVGLGFNGTVCRCHIYSDISGGKTIVEATCTKEFENSPGAETCRCNGMVTAQCVVNPTASNQGKKSIKVNLNSGLCQQYCEENQGNQAVTCSSTTPCSGSSGCPGAAVEVREAFSREVLYEQSTLTHMECSHDIEYHACTNALAPCHCRYSEHTDGICVPHAADPCSGVQHHEIVIHQAASGPGAQQCPPDHELNFVSSCRVENCQRDCVTGPWSAWGACDAACGAGQQHRTREVFVTPQGGGAACDVLSESRDCTGVACPVNCTLSEWVNGPCNAVCGEGTYERTRTVTEPAQNDGHCEGVLRQTLPCVGLEPCPVDCRLSDWSAFSACTASCGAEATKTRTRTVTTQPAHGGTACGALTETVPCGHDPCPIDCDVTPFGAWQPCSAPCGTGSRTRSRVVITAPQHGGAACPALTENEVCNAHACECKLGEWSEWSTCSAQCGSGSQERTREILDNPGNATCAPALESRACNVAPCPVNCETSEWGAWAECTEPCGPNGVRRRLRTVVTAPQHNGTACGPLMEEEPCNTHSCPVHCQVGEWTEYGACSSPCGGGTRTRTRAITTPPQGGGSACPALEETVSCNTQVCANCTVGDWGQWSSCSAACGLGKQARNRSVTTPPQPGGTCNAALHEERQCDAGPCPCDCTVGDWSAWSACSEQCGENGGTQTRHRAVTRDAVGKGHACPALNQTRRCNVGAPCEAACQVSAFGAWGDCSAACGGGVQSRTRTVTKPGVGSTAAAACPELSETRVCNEAACPAPATCAAGQWSAWSACSRQCGGGTMSRTRALTRNNTDASPCSLELRQEQACKTAPCPVTCETGAWGDWSSCSSPCGGGVQERVRKVEQPPVSGGGACNPTVEVRECNTQTCGNHTGPCDALPPKCDTDKCRCHSCCADKRPPAWSPCRPKCGGGAGGTQTRVRSCPSCPSSCSEHHNEERACALAKDAAHDTSHCPSKPAMDGAATSKAAATVKTLPGKAPAAASAHRMVPARIVPNTLSPK